MKKVSFLVVVLCTLFSVQTFAQTISGDITYSGVKSGIIYVVYVAAGPGPACDTADWSSYTQVAVGGDPYPVPYTLNVPTAGSYCVAAYLDAAPTGSTPDFTDPLGIYNNFTPVTTDATNIDITLYDPGNLGGVWSVTADVSIGPPVDTNCTYTGAANIWNIQDMAFGYMTLSTSSQACAPYSPLDINIFCDVSALPALDCTLIGPPGSPYSTTGTVSSSGFSASGTFQGSYQGADFSVSWNANKSASSIPTMTEWGMIIFIVLAGLGAIYFLRRQRRPQS